MATVIRWCCMTISQIAGWSASSREPVFPPVSVSPFPPRTMRRARIIGTAFFSAPIFSIIPHLAIWPDAYYMADNVFNSGGTARLGPQPFAFDRAKMLAGLPATFVTTGITNGASEAYYLPADLDGSVPPPAGAPATFVGWPNSGVYKIYHFHADLLTPANTTFTLFASHRQRRALPNSVPGNRNCVPQLGSTTRLDAIGDRFMHRLAYRNFGTHESVVGELYRQRQRRGRDSLGRVAQRDRRARDGLSGEHVSTRYDLALDGQRGDGPGGKHGPRLQRFECND